MARPEGLVLQPALFSIMWAGMGSKGAWIRYYGPKRVAVVAAAVTSPTKLAALRAQAGLRHDDLVAELTGRVDEVVAEAADEAAAIEVDDDDATVDSRAAADDDDDVGYYSDGVFDDPSYEPGDAPKPQKRLVRSSGEAPLPKAAKKPAGKKPAGKKPAGKKPASKKAA